MAATNKKLVRAVFTVPKMTTLRLWAGAYGGHYSIVVFFKDKPTHRMDEKGDTSPRGKYVDVYEEWKDRNVFADVSAGTFEDWFLDVPVDITATEVLYRELFEIELTIPLDEYGDWIGLDPHCDWR